MPIDRDFLYEYAKNPQVQQAARDDRLPGPGSYSINGHVSGVYPVF
jgi:hypothetical protein